MSDTIYNNQDEADFHAAFEDFGGIINYNILPEMRKTKDHLVSVIKLIQKIKPGLPQCSINFIQNDTFGACARAHNGKYFIGINDSVQALISVLFNRMLASPHVLKDFGDVTLEKEHEMAYNVHIYDLSYIDFSNTPIPVDPKRRLLASLLTQIVLDTIVIHEFAHIINGHVDYKGSSKSITEANKQDLTEEESLLSQTLEMDADCFSVLRGLDILEIRFKHDSWRNQFAHVFTDFNQCIYLWSFSVYSIWRLFGLNEYKIEKLTTYSHPPPGIRQRITLSLIHTIYQAKGNANEMTQLCLQAAYEVEHAFSLISEMDKPFNAMIFANQKECVDHMHVLMRYWKNVRPLIEPFATNGLAPLPED